MPGAEQAGVPLLAVLGGDEGVERLDVLAERAEPIRAYVEREPQDEAVILYTSGTTGAPKGAVLTQLNMTMNAIISATSVLQLTADDVILGCLPLFHSFGQTCAMNAGFFAGSTLVLLPRFDGAAALDLIINEKVNVFEGVPTMYIALLAAAREDERRPELRRAVSGGASLPVAVIDAFKRVFGADIYEGYGLSETSPVATFNQAVFGRKPGTVGRPIWGTDAEIADPAIEDRIELLAQGQVGEVVLRGHNIFAGYLNNPQATRAVLVDGWFRTGDLGSMDADGFQVIVAERVNVFEVYVPRSCCGPRCPVAHRRRARQRLRRRRHLRAAGAALADERRPVLRGHNIRGVRWREPARRGDRPLPSRSSAPTSTRVCNVPGGHVQPGGIQPQAGHGRSADLGDRRGDRRTGGGGPHRAAGAGRGRRGGAARAQHLRRLPEQPGGHRRGAGRRLVPDR